MEGMGDGPLHGKGKRRTGSTHLQSLTRLTHMTKVDTMRCLAGKNRGDHQMEGMGDGAIQSRAERGKGGHATYPPTMLHNEHSST